MSALAVTDAVLLEFAEDIGAEGPVAVEGRRTRWSVGGPLAPEARIVGAPSGIVAYAASEMTVKVRAGTPVAELDVALAMQGQRCALPDRGGTVGGAIAVGENAVDVLGRGRVRDAVLQVRYVSAEGEVVTGGGPVVKNVTGFNLPKVMTGSLGTLGVLTECILRTNPIPAAARWLQLVGVDPSAVFAALYRPSAVLTDSDHTWVLLEGHAPDLNAQQSRLAEISSVMEVAGPPALPAHRWTLTPAAAAQFAVDHPGVGFIASIGVGMVWADQPQPRSPIDAGAAVIAARLKHNFDPTGRLNPGRVPGS